MFVTYFFRKWVLLIGLALTWGTIFTGCATIFSDGPDTISFNANVDKVKVFMDGSLIGETPLTIPVKRKLQNRKVKFVKEGYETQEFSLAHEFNNNFWVILDITGTLTSLTPGVVDVLSGNLIRYSPTEYHIELVPIRSSNNPLFRKRVLSKRFAAFNFEDIRQNVAIGNGEFLDGLAGSFFITSEHKEDFDTLISANAKDLLSSENGLVLWGKINQLLSEYPILQGYWMDLS